MTTFNNLKSPKWTEEEKNILNEEASKAPISPPMLDRLQKKLPNRTRAAIASAIKRYVTKTPEEAKPVESNIEKTDLEVLKLLRNLVVLKIATADQIVDSFSLEHEYDIVYIKAKVAKEELVKAVEEGHMSLDQIAKKYDLTTEKVKEKLYG